MNPIRLSLWALAVLIGCANAVGAQAPAGSRTRSQRVDPLTSSIQGRITTADTGAPIRGAEVRLSMDGSFSRLVTTDGEGRFELRSLPAGSYKLIVSKSGFITLEYGQRRPFESASTISVREGESATGNVALIRGGAISGRLIDEFGDPSIGTRVQVMRLRADGGSRRLVPVGAGDQTDDTGAFRLYGLPAGEYYLSASTGLIDAVKRDPPVYYPGTMNVSEAQPIVLAPGAETSADFQIAAIARAATVSGVVLNSSGGPAPGAMVNLSSNTVGTINSVPSPQTMLMLHADAAPDGSFTIQNVPPGSYTLTAQLPLLFDAAFTAAQQAVRGAGPPPPEMVSGNFTVGNAAVREQMLNRMPETASMPINVTSEGMSGIALTTRRGGRLSGRIVADAGVGRPLPTGLQVTLRSPGPGGMSMQMSGGSATNDFQLVGASGPSRIDVQGIPDGWAVKAIMLDGEDVTDEAIDMTGRSGLLRVIMTDRLTALSGTIQSNTDSRDHIVVVFPEDATKWTSPSRFVRTTRADADGRFQIRGLPPADRYLVAALEHLEDGEERDRQLLERLRIRATSVSLGDGEQRSIQLGVISR